MKAFLSERVRVQIAHDSHLIAAGVAAALREQPGLEVLDEDVEGRSQEFSVVITDYDEGLRRAKNARERIAPYASSASRFMVVTTKDKEFEVRQALEAGIHGYVLANCESGELVRCVRALAQGARYVSQPVAQRIADSMTREVLTAREIDVLRLLVQGQCNKTIAIRLDIALGTVKAHVKAIMAKLEARSRTHAVTVANERGIACQPERP